MTRRCVLARDRYSFGQGDIQRTQNQGLLIIVALQTMQARAMSGGQVLGALSTLAQHVVLEDAKLVDLYRIGAGGCSPSTRQHQERTVIPDRWGRGHEPRTVGTDALFADFR